MTSFVFSGLIDLQGATLRTTLLSIDVIIRSIPDRTGALAGTRSPSLNCQNTNLQYSMVMLSHLTCHMYSNINIYIYICIVKQLLEARASINQEAKGKTALQWARKKEHKEIAALLNDTS